MNYAYANQFFSDKDITAVMDTWYANGIQVVFSGGGGLYLSAAEAAGKTGGKVIGVDTDQSVLIDSLCGEGTTLTSAMKGLNQTVCDTLTDVIKNDNWAAYAGKFDTLGLVSGDEPAANYVLLSPTTQFVAGKFSESDYAALVRRLYDGTVTVTYDYSTMPAVTNTTIINLGNLK